MHELPLVFFTVFAQSAVGLMLLVFIANQGKLSNESVLNKANLLAFLLTGIGMLIGIFHLGHMFRAANMLAGIGRSPMSNESVLSGAFMLLLCITIFFTYISKNALLRKISNIVALVIGLAFVWSITEVYQLNTVANWNTGHTSLQMWMTVLIGGGACAMLVGARKIGAIGLLAGVVISLLAKPDYFSFISQTSGQMAIDQSWFWGIQLVCMAIGVIAAALALFKKGNVSSMLAISALIVVAGELSARIAFYNLWAITM